VSFLVSPFKRAIAAAAALTGRRFGLLVASSVVATSAIVASAITNPEGPVGPLAALLGRSLAAEDTPVEPSPASRPSQPASGTSQPSRFAGGGSEESAGGPPASPVPSPSPEGGGPKNEAPTNTNNEEEAPSLPEAGRIKHVFVISLASPGYEKSFGKEAAAQMPYLSETLRPTGTLLSKYSLLSETALPNGLAAIGGQAPTAKTRENCPKFDCLLSAEETTLADQLSAARFTWRGYIEGMTDPTGKSANCVYPGPGETLEPALGGYAVWQNPFAYFHSLLDLGECSANDVPLTELPAALKSAKKTPDFSFIAPDLCDAGLTGQCPEGQASGAAAADAFLSQWVPKIVATPTFKQDGLLIVTFNQVDPEAAPSGGKVPPLQTGALLVSPFAAPGETDARSYNPYSVLRSTEELFGIEYFLAEAAGKRVGSFAGPLLGEEGSEG
jgi:phosphatidylinositol-3-phosphatase